MALLPMFLWSCSENFIEQENPKQPINESRPDLTAAFADVATRTYVENDKYLRWHEDDHLTVFYANTLNDQYKFKGQTGDNSGTFALVPSGELGTGNTLPNIYAIYPYNADARISDDGIITYSFPATQNYAENSFAKDANTMVAVTNGISDTFLSFRNVCGYLKLKLYGDATIKSIEVRGNFGEKIAGDATITATYGEIPSFTMNDTATDVIIINCGEGITLGATAEEATVFWVVIPETIFKYGITITATSVDNKVFTKSTSNSVVIERNTPLPMSALEFVGEVNEITPIAPSTITYTTDDGNVVDLYTTEGFGANYVYNVYDTENNIGTITFDGEITSIPAEAFLVCTNLTSVQIPNTVTTIAERAFYGCNYMEKIIIPESVTQIVETAFEGCSGEAYISCNVNDKAFVGALFTKVVMDDNVTSIGESAFASCDNLKEVILPKELTKLEYCAFIYCSNLERVINTENITHIADGVFAETGITHMSLPNVDYIGDRAFEMCTSLEAIHLSNTMSYLGKSVFNQCASLTSISIPEGITTLQQDTFNYCTKLQSISFPITLSTLYGSFYGCTALNRIDIKDFDAWCNLEILSSPGYLGGVTPFDDSDGGDIYINGEQLTNVVFSNKVVTIREDLFHNCINIETVTFGSRVSKIEANAFWGCTRLTTISLPKTVVSIGSGAFANTSLTQLDIPSSITSIPANFVRNCSELTIVNMPSTIKTIGNNAFQGCEKLYQITIPDGVTSIGSGAFKDCKSIPNITLPEGLLSIGEAAFSGCEEITEITIPENITTIYTNCFNGCVNLKTIALSSNIKKIGNWAFQKCLSLSDIVLPETLTSIGRGAFSSCSMSTIVIPPRVNYIDFEAFNNVPLSEIYFKPTEVPYLGFVEGVTFRDATIYVPNTSLELYKEAWGEMASRIVGYDF